MHGKFDILVFAIHSIFRNIEEFPYLYHALKNHPLFLPCFFVPGCDFAIDSKLENKIAIVCKITGLCYLLTSLFFAIIVVLALPAFRSMFFSAASQSCKRVKIIPEVSFPRSKPNEIAIEVQFNTMIVVATHQRIIICTSTTERIVSSTA